MPIVPKQPSIKGTSEWFTGDVYIDPVARGDQPSRIQVNAVHFTPGARTAWHSHGLGQTLYVTEGVGRHPEPGRRGPRNPRRGRDPRPRAKSIGMAPHRTTS